MAKQAAMGWHSAEVQDVSSDGETVDAKVVVVRVVKEVRGRPTIEAPADDAARRAPRRARASRGGGTRGGRLAPHSVLTVDDGLFGEECLAEAVGGLGRVFVCHLGFGHGGDHKWTAEPLAAGGTVDGNGGVLEVDAPPDFVAFHRAHPEVYDGLARLARRVVDAGGARHLSVRMLWETLRYETALGAGAGEEPYRLNNNHVPHYARLLMEREPLLGDLVEVRALRPRDAYPPSP